jgi:hypothetical protein
VAGEDDRGARVMHRYQCYFLGPNDKRLVVEEIEAMSDQDAVERARDRFLLLAPFPTFELWRDDQRLHREERSAAPARDGAAGQPELLS